MTGSPHVTANWRVGIVPIDRSERVPVIVVMDEVERIVGVVLIERVHRTPGVEFVVRIERVFRIIGADGIQRIIGAVLIDRVEDVVVTLVLPVEPGFCSCGTSREEKTEEPDYARGKPCLTHHILP